ncbi:MAG: HEAT repeat domain-containing protein [bacterium]
MRTLTLLASLLIAGASATGAQASASATASATGLAYSADGVGAPTWRAFRTSQPIDTPDSLYRAARAALTDGDFKRAATLFATVADKYPDSEFAPDALYYRAYALFKSGTSRELEMAVSTLDRQAIRYPKAGTLNDAKQLRASIRSEQAKRGNGEAGLEIAAGATSLRNATQCPTDDDDMRLTALAGIIQLDPDQVLPVLQKLLERKDECSIRLRKRAVNMVAQTKEEERADILLRVASTDPSPEVRREAVQWLSSVNTERAAKALDSILFNAVDADTRDRALSALSQHKSPSARATLRRFAEQTRIPTELRVRAVYYLTQGRRTGSSDESEFLHTLFSKTASPELREAIIQGIANQRTADRTPWLLGLARDKNLEIETRKRALYYAGQTPCCSAVPQVARADSGMKGATVPTYGLELKDVLPLYEEFNGQPEMQEQMLYVYAQRRETEVTDKLLQIAKSEKNPELRKKTISWLSQRKDPRVKQFLLDLINQ